MSACWLVSMLLLVCCVVVVLCGCVDVLLLVCCFVGLLCCWFVGLFALLSRWCDVYCCVALLVCRVVVPFVCYCVVRVCMVVCL